MSDFKKETLEKAAKTLAYACEDDFIKGVKWQQKQMFLVMDKYVDDVMGGCNLRAKEWFEQYKK